jgi:hypothetical protein
MFDVWAATVRIAGAMPAEETEYFCESRPKRNGPARDF